MTETEKRVPELRFKGFLDAWEQRTLENIFGKIRNAFVGTATPYYVENGHFYLESNNVKDGKINRNSEIFINDEFYEKQKDKWLHTHDLVMVQSGHVGHAAVIPEELDGTAAHALIMFQDYKVNSNPYFLNYQFQTTDSKKKLETITTGNTIKHILASEMKIFEVTLPNFEEQTKIGNFFKNLDNTIALHQRKLASLKQLKQSYLQVLFPKNKGNNPPLRFYVFSDSWEQRKLGELLSEVKRPIKMNDDECYELVTVKRRNEGIVSRGIFQGKDVLVKSQFQIKTGDYLISKRQVVHGANGIVPRNLNNAIVSNEYLVSIGNKNVTTDFLSIISRRPDMYKKFFLSSYGIDIEKLVFNVEDWKKRTIQIPSVSEQNQISIFFKQLDNTIDLHQCQLEKLLELKNVLLRKMFL